MNKIIKDNVYCIDIIVKKRCMIYIDFLWKPSAQKKEEKTATPVTPPQKKKTTTKKTNNSVH